MNNQIKTRSTTVFSVLRSSAFHAGVASVVASEPFDPDAT